MRRLTRAKATRACLACLGLCVTEMEGLVRCVESKEGTEGWVKACSAFAHVFRVEGGEKCAEAGFQGSDKRRVIPAMIETLRALISGDTPDWKSVRPIAASLRLLTPVSKDIDALFSNRAVEAVSAVVRAGAVALASDDASDDATEAIKSSLAVLVNSHVLNRATMNAICETSLDAPALVRLVATARARKPTVYFYAMRTLFFVVLVPKIALRLVEPASEAKESERSRPLYPMLVDHLCFFLKPQLLTDQARETERKLAIEILKVCFNLGYSPRVPRLGSKLSTQDRERLSDALSSAMALGVDPDPFGDRAAEDELDAEAAAILAVADTAAANDESKSLVLQGDERLEGSFRRKMEDLKKAESGGSAAGAAGAATRKLTKEDEEEWNKALKRIESKKKASIPSPKPRERKQKGPDYSLFGVKCQIVNFFVTSDVGVSLRLRADVFQGLAEVLDACAKKDPERPQNSVLPILTVLTKLCKTSAGCRAHLKRFVFGKDARASGSGAAAGGGKGKKDKNMSAPPGVNIRTMRDENGKLDLRSILTKHICTFMMSLKALLSEFLFILAGEDSNEYIRLVGFGAAVGLLADKGLPGFEHVASQALSLDDLVKAKRARDKNSGAK